MVSEQRRVRCYIRIRACLPKEIDEPCCIAAGEDQRSVRVAADQPATFDRVFLPETPLQEMCQLCLVPAVRDCLNGLHASLMFYGQTGSGKTYSMRQFLPTFVRTLFAVIEKEENEYETTVSVDCAQVYLEAISDLIDPRRTHLQIREFSDTGVFVKGACELPVTSPQEFDDIWARAEKNRVCGATALNDVSSRSHCIVGFTVTRRKKLRKEHFSVSSIENASLLNNTSGVGLSAAAGNTSSHAVPMRTTGRFSFVDLAGSERLKKSHSEGIRKAEAKIINQSLSTLGNVMRALTDAKASHVPYRDSKLTRLLQESLGRGGGATIIVNIPPLTKFASETRNSLQFGLRAMEVVTSITTWKDVDGKSRMMQAQDWLENRVFYLEECLAQQQELLAQHSPTSAAAVNAATCTQCGILKAEAHTMQSLVDEAKQTVETERKKFEVTCQRYDSRLDSLNNDVLFYKKRCEEQGRAPVEATDEAQRRLAALQEYYEGYLAAEKEQSTLLQKERNEACSEVFRLTKELQEQAGSLSRHANLSDAAIQCEPLATRTVKTQTTGSRVHFKDLDDQLQLATRLVGDYQLKFTEEWRGLVATINEHAHDTLASLVEKVTTAASSEQTAKFNDELASVTKSAAREVEKEVASAQVRIESAFAQAEKLQKENSVLQDRLKTSERYGGALQRQCDELGQKLVDAELHHDEFKKKAADEQNEQEARAEESSAATAAKIKEMAERMQTKEALLHDAIEATKLLEQQYHDTMAKLQRAEKESDAVRHRVDELEPLEGLVRDLEAQLQEMEISSDDRVAQTLQRAANDAQDHSQRMAAMQQQHMAELREVQIASANQIGLATQDVEEYRKRLHEMEMELERVRNVHNQREADHLDALTAKEEELIGAVRDVKELRRRLKHTEDQVRSVEEAEARNDDRVAAALRKAAEDTKVQSGRMLEMQAAHTAEVAEIHRVATEQAASASTELEQSRAEMRRVHQELQASREEHNRALEDQLEQLSKRDATVSQLKKHVAELTRQLASQEQARGLLATSLESNEQRLAELLQKSAADATEQSSRMEAMATSHREEMVEVTKRYDAAVAEHASTVQSLKTDLHRATQLGSQLQQELSQTNAIHVEDMENQTSTNREKEASYTATISNLKEELAVVTLQLHSAQNEAERNVEQRAMDDEAAKAKTHRVHSLEIARLSQQLEHLQQANDEQLADLQEELRRAGSQRDQLREELGRAKRDALSKLEEERSLVNASHCSELRAREEELDAIHGKEVKALRHRLLVAEEHLQQLRAEEEESEHQFAEGLRTATQEAKEARRKNQALILEHNVEVAKLNNLLSEEATARASEVLQLRTELDRAKEHVAACEQSMDAERHSFESRLATAEKRMAGFSEDAEAQRALVESARSALAAVERELQQERDHNALAVMPPQPATTATAVQTGSQLLEPLVDASTAPLLDEIHRLQQEITAAESAVSAVTRKMQDMERRNTTATETAEELSATVAQLRDQLHQAQQQARDNATTHSQQLQAAEAAHTAALRDTHEKFRARAKTDLTRAATEHEEECDALRAELTQEHRRVVATMTIKLEESEKALATLRAKHHTTVHEHHMMQEQLTSMELRYREQERRVKEDQIIQLQQRESIAGNGSSTNSSTSAESNSALLQTLQLQLDATQREVEALRQQLNAARNDVAAASERQQEATVRAVEAESQVATQLTAHHKAICAIEAAHTNELLDMQRVHQHREQELRAKMNRGAHNTQEAACGTDSEHVRTPSPPSFQSAEVAAPSQSLHLHVATSEQSPPTVLSSAATVNETTVVTLAQTTEKMKQHKKEAKQLKSELKTAQRQLARTEAALAAAVEKNNSVHYEAMTSPPRQLVSSSTPPSLSSHVVDELLQDAISARKNLQKQLLAAEDQKASQAATLQQQLVDQHQQHASEVEALKQTHLTKIEGWKQEVNALTLKLKASTEDLVTAKRRGSSIKTKLAATKEELATAVKELDALRMQQQLVAVEHNAALSRAEGAKRVAQQELNHAVDKADKLSREIAKRDHLLSQALPAAATLSASGLSTLVGLESSSRMQVERLVTRSLRALRQCCADTAPTPLTSSSVAHSCEATQTPTIVVPLVVESAVQTDDAVPTPALSSISCERSEFVEHSVQVSIDDHQLQHSQSSSKFFCDDDRDTITLVDPYEQEDVVGVPCAASHAVALAADHSSRYKLVPSSAATTPLKQQQLQSEPSQPSSSGQPLCVTTFVHQLDATAAHNVSCRISSIRNAASKAVDACWAESAATVKTEALATQHLVESFAEWCAAAGAVFQVVSATAATEYAKAATTVMAVTVEELRDVVMQLEEDEDKEQFVEGEALSTSSSDEAADTLYGRRGRQDHEAHRAHYYAAALDRITSPFQRSVKGRSREAADDMIQQQYFSSRRQSDDSSHSRQRCASADRYLEPKGLLRCSRWAEHQQQQPPKSMTSLTARRASSPTPRSTLFNDRQEHRRPRTASTSLIIGCPHAAMVSNIE